METKLAKIEKIEFTPSRNFTYAHALASNNGSWWSRAWDEKNGGAKTALFYLSSFSFVDGGILSLLTAAMFFSSGVSCGLALSVFSGVFLSSLPGLYINSRWTKKRNEKNLANQEWKFFYCLAQGVEAFNRRATAWNGMLAALELGAEDRMSREEKEKMHRMLTSAREELARKVQLAESLMLPSYDHRPEVAAYLEELRDAEQELPGRIAVPEKALNQNNFQEVLENEVALFEYAGELKALPPKES